MPKITPRYYYINARDVQGHEQLGTPKKRMMIIFSSQIKEIVKK